MKKIILVLVICIPLASGRANVALDATADDSLKTYAVPGIVVTATRTEKRPEEVGRSVSVLSGDRLRNSLYHSIAEALSTQEGVYLVGAGQNFGMNQSIFMRGAGTNQTAVMVDGVRITDPSGVNNALDFSELSLAGWDRIEIVRGSHSTLFGSSAVGGVINLITRKGDAAGFHGDAELRTGTFGKGTSVFSQNLSLQVGLASGFFAAAEFLNLDSRGLDATIDTTANGTSAVRRDQDGLRAQDVVGKLGYRDARVELFATLRNHSETKDIDKSAYVDDDNATIDFKRSLWTYGAVYHPEASWTLKFSGGYSDMRRVAVDDSSLVGQSGSSDHTYSDARYSGTMLTNELQATLRMTDLEIVLGAGSYRETMSIQSYFRTSSFFGPFEFSSNLDSLRLSATTRNVFAQLDLSGTMIAPGWEKFNLMVGARLNHHSAFGTDASVEFNPAYRIDHGGILYASFSTGLNAPSLYQLYTPERDYSSGITRGNPGLQPERSRSLEFGWKYSSSGGLFCSLALFGTIVENSIEYVYLWEKSVSIDQLGKDFSRNDFRGDTYLNLSRQTTRGFEGTFGTRLGDRWSITANLSVVGGTLEYHPSDINQLQTQGHWVQLYGNGAFLTQDLQSTDLVRRPNTANVSLEYRAMEAWTLRFDVRHAGQRSDVYYDSQRGPYGALGSQPVEAYTIVDLLQHFQFGKDWSANFRVENVMNKKYLEINGFTTRGRGVYLNIRSQWDRLW